MHTSQLCDELSNTTSLLDLPLSLLAEVSRPDNDGDLWKSALAKDLGVAERKEVEDGGGIGLLVVHVGITGFGGDEGP